MQTRAAAQCLQLRFLPPCLRSEPCAVLVKGLLIPCEYAVHAGPRGEGATDAVRALSSTGGNASMGDACVVSGQLYAAQSEWNRLGLYGSGVVASTRFKSHAEWGLLMV
jgi:hypothetical protein